MSDHVNAETSNPSGGGPRYLSGAEIDTLYKLGWAHPHGVEDGDIPSKSGRDSLIGRGLAAYQNGVTYLNRKGFVKYITRKKVMRAKV